MNIDYNSLMREAFGIATANKTPYAAIIVNNDSIIARSANTTGSKENNLFHAEISAMNKVAKTLHNKSNTDFFTLISTVEPCVMCAGAIGWNKIDKVVFSLTLEKLLELDSGKQFNIESKVVFDSWSDSPIELEGGILEEEGIENFINNNKK